MLILKLTKCSHAVRYCGKNLFIKSIRTADDIVSAYIPGGRTESNQMIGTSSYLAPQRKNAANDENIAEVPEEMKIIRGQN